MSMSIVGVRLVKMPVDGASPSQNLISSSLASILLSQPLIGGALPMTGIGLKPARCSLSRYAVISLIAKFRAIGVPRSRGLLHYGHSHRKASATEAVTEALGLLAKQPHRPLDRGARSALRKRYFALRG